MAARMYQHSIPLRPGPRSEPQLGIDADGRATVTIYLADDSFLIARTAGELDEVSAGFAALAETTAAGARLLETALGATAAIEECRQ